MDRKPNGQFAPGVSGNPGGRPKHLKEVVELAREHTPDAIKTLASIMQDEKQPPAARVRAAGELLNRGWGQPAQYIEHNETEVQRPDIDFDDLLRKWRTQRDKTKESETTA